MNHEAIGGILLGALTALGLVGLFVSRRYSASDPSDPAADWKLLIASLMGNVSLWVCIAAVLILVARFLT